MVLKNQQLHSNLDKQQYILEVLLTKYHESNTVNYKNIYKAMFDIHTKVVEREDEIDPRAVCGVSLGETPEGHPVYARYARSPYVEYREDTAGVPEDLPLDQLTVEKALEYINAPPDRELGTDPETGLPVVIAEDPLSCVAIGTGKALDEQEIFSTVLSEY